MQKQIFRMGSIELEHRTDLPLLRLAYNEWQIYNSLFYVNLVALPKKLHIASFKRFLIVNRRPDSKGKWRKYHWENVLSGHSLDPKQVSTQIWIFPIVVSDWFPAGLLKFTMFDCICYFTVMPFLNSAWCQEMKTHCSWLVFKDHYSVDLISS